MTSSVDHLVCQVRTTSGIAPCRHFEDDPNMSFAMLEEDAVTKRPVSLAACIMHITKAASMVSHSHSSQHCPCEYIQSSKDSIHSHSEHPKYVALSVSHIEQHCPCMHIWRRHTFSLCPICIAFCYVISCMPFKAWCAVHCCLDDTWRHELVAALWRPL